MKAAKQPIIVDTNILFSALLTQRSSFADILLTTTNDFFVCEMVLVELFKHKEKIIRLSRLSEDEIIQLYQIYLKRLHLHKEALISLENRRQAYELCHDIDKHDSAHVALTLELQGLLWTGDKVLKNGLLKKGFKQFFEAGHFMDSQVEP
ncbi:MAG: PIN domain-containing protein [Methylococcales bacterium]